MVRHYSAPDYSLGCEVVAAALPGYEVAAGALPMSPRAEPSPWDEAPWLPATKSHRASDAHHTSPPAVESRCSHQDDGDHRRDATSAMPVPRPHGGQSRASFLRFKNRTFGLCFHCLTPLSPEHRASHIVTTFAASPTTSLVIGSVNAPRPAAPASTRQISTPNEQGARSWATIVIGTPRPPTMLPSTDMIHANDDSLRTAFADTTPAWGPTRRP